MTKNELLKKSIHSAFARKEFELAFDQLFNLPHYDISKLLRTNDWLCANTCSEYFWKKYALIKHVTVFGPNHGDVVLEMYWKNTETQIGEIEDVLVEYYPEKFLKSIKTNRVFLKDVVLERLFTLHWSPKYSEHLIAWKELNKIDRKLDKRIQFLFQETLKLKLAEKLSFLTIWVEKELYTDRSSSNFDRIRRVYDYAVSLLMSDSVSNPVCESEFNEQYGVCLRSPENEVINLMEAIREWIKFESTILTSYCFDENFIPKMIQGQLNMEFESSDTYKLWQKDGERYLLNRKRYIIDGIREYKYRVANGSLNIPIKESEKENKINHNMFIQYLQGRDFLTDLCINNFNFKKRKVHVSKVLQTMNGFSTNRYYRYVEPLNGYARQGLPWLMSVYNVMLTAQKNGVENLPIAYIYEERENLIKLFIHAIPELTEDESEDILNHFGYTISSKIHFDRFNIRYSALETPFLRFGNIIFCPTSLFACNDFFYSFAQRSLNILANQNHEKERRETASLMENLLAEEFIQHRWEAKVITDLETNQMDGDIDIFVTDGKEQILIQLKRTKFKLNLAQLHKESLETDLMASGQINEAIKCLQSNQTSLNIEILPNAKKWIVTTSFEGVLTTIDGCMKINYFDLLWALRHQQFSNLVDLIQYMENDRPFEDCKHYLDLEF